MLENDKSSLYDEDGEICADCAITYDEEEEVNEGKWALRDRLKSRVLWASLIGCLCTIFSVFGIWDKIGITAAGFNEVIAAIGTMLTAFGVLNDPTNREGF